MRKIGESGAGFVEGTVPLSSTEQKITLSDIQNLQASIDALVTAINGNLSFGTGASSSRMGNFDAQVIEFVTAPSELTEFAVPHGLGRRPIGFLELQRLFDAGWSGKPQDLYASRLGSWTEKVVYFVCDVPSARRLVALI